MQDRLHHQVHTRLQLRDEQVELALGVWVAVQWELRAGAIEAPAQAVRPLSQDAGKLRKRDGLRPGARRGIEDNGLLPPRPQRNRGLPLRYQRADGGEKVGGRLPAVRRGQSHPLAG